MHTSRPLLLHGLLATLLLAACEEEDPEVVREVRAIKTYSVIEVASGQTRKFSGQVEATDSSTLSFQVGGNVNEMRVVQGDVVDAGQVLAVLDKQPYELDVEAMKAALDKAQVEAEQSQKEFERQEQLFSKGWIAEARLDRNRRVRDAAINQVEFATSKLNLARRDLRLTELTAPFAGSISRKYIDAFVEVRPGQQVYEMIVSGTSNCISSAPAASIS